MKTRKKKKNKKYNISKEELLNINGITDVNINDKLLIPIINE